MALPRGATAVDFAYAVHTDIGHHCVAARINYELLPLRTELKNGDHVEILTSPTARPNPSWLSFVATGKARSRIRHFLKGLQQKESAALGERLLEQALATLKVAPESITWDRWEALQKEYGAKTPARDPGRHRPRQAAFVRRRAGAHATGRQDRGRGRQVPRRRRRPRPLTLRGVEGVAIQYAKCCRPIPGDAVVGQFRKGQGLLVHTRDCVDAAQSSASMAASWSTSNGRPTCRACSTPACGCWSPTGAGCSRTSPPRSRNADANIDTVSMERPDGGDVAMFFSVQVRDRRHLAHVMRALRRVPDVRHSVARART